MAEKWGQVKAVYGEKERKFYVDPMMANEFIFSIVNFFFFILQVKSSSPNITNDQITSTGSKIQSAHSRTHLCVPRLYWRLRSPTNQPWSSTKTWVLSETSGSSDTTWTEWTRCGSNCGSASRKQKGREEDGTAGAVHLEHLSAWRPQLCPGHFTLIVTHTDTYTHTYTYTCVQGVCT